MTLSQDWHVLIVEDDPNSIDVVEDALHLYRHTAEIRCAVDGSECLDMLGSYRPTFVIMDLALPKINGWEALEAIRHNPATADLPVIAITAYHSAHVAEDAVRAGFDAYFPKPIDVFSFGQNVERVLGRAI